MSTSERPEHVKIQMSQMIDQIKALKPVIGSGRVKTFAKKTLKSQLRLRKITEEEYAELMSRLGYDE